MTVIQDGIGKGFQAQVTSKNQVSVFAVTETEYHDFSEAGDAYSITSGSVSRSRLSFSRAATQGLLTSRLAFEIGRREHRQMP